MPKTKVRVFISRSFNLVDPIKEPTWLISDEQAQKNRQLPVFC
ncbi:hypothetical protein PALI_a0311 [Pseudoalteromonas aliena SW19]|uniref:Uncharacterized protein n=1 Tax=Pseudoalteromonas aliena SW19 TaxID=1314866 RepID=A0ABR9DXL7_9GAMM|nr:hypothetical protein [Pseudoalteromonas aliena SW19]